LRVETTGHTILTLMNVIFTFKSDVSLKIPWDFCPIARVTRN
jgi:hypothetical protein